MNEPVLSPQIRQVMEALEANNMTAHYLPRADQVVAIWPAAATSTWTGAR